MWRFHLKERIEKRYMLAAFLAAFLPRLVFLAGVHTMSIAGDEIFAMWPAAKFAGYSWEQVMQSYRYYGYGYTVLLFPFMAFIRNPVILYRCMVLLMILAQSLVAPTACHLMRVHLKVKNKIVLCLSGIACSYLVAVRAVYTYPEFIYVLVVWLIAWVILKLVRNLDDRKKKAVDTVLLVLLLSYAMTVHSRATALWAAAVAAVVIFGWIYRRCLVSLPILVVLGSGGYLLSRVGIETTVQMLGFSSAAGVGNTGTGSYLQMIGYLMDPTYWPAWVNIIVGQLNESIINTGGFAVAIVVALLVLLWKGLRREKEIIASWQTNYELYMALGTFCFTAVVITIAGQSLSWLPGAYEAMRGGDEDALRAFTYFRYYGAYVGPLLMLGIAYFYHNLKILDWIQGKVLLISSILQGYWVLCILPYVCYYSGCVWSYAPFSITKGFQDDIGLRSYLPGTLVIFIMLFAGWYVCRKKKYTVLLGMLCVFLIYSYGYNAVYHEGYRSSLNYAYTEDGRELLEYLKETGECPEEIYVEDTSVPQSGQSVSCLYQFDLLETSVIAGSPDGDVEEAFFICYHPEEYQELLKDGYKMGELPDQGYVFVKGGKLQQAATDGGVIYE